jgi:hypothetical protein
MNNHARFIAFAAASAAITLLGSTSTGEAGAQFAVFGAGASSCTTWDRSVYHLDDRREQVSWIYGYISGRSDNAQRQAALKRTSGYGITNWVDNYCTRHPNDLLIGVAEKLLTELDKTAS